MKYFKKNYDAVIVAAVVLLISSFAVLIVRDSIREKRRSNQHIVTVLATLVTGKEVTLSFYVPPKYQLGIEGHRGGYSLYYVDRESMFKKITTLRHGVIDYKIIKK